MQQDLKHNVAVKTENLDSEDYPIQHIKIEPSEIPLQSILDVTYTKGCLQNNIDMYSPKYSEQFADHMEGFIKSEIEVQYDQLSDIDADNLVFKPGPSKVVATPDDLKTHTKSLHPSGEQIEWFYCECCVYKTRTQEALQKHVGIWHSSDDVVAWYPLLSFNIYKN